MRGCPLARPCFASPTDDRSSRAARSEDARRDLVAAEATSVWFLTIAAAAAAFWPAPVVVPQLLHWLPWHRNLHFRRRPHGRTRPPLPSFLAFRDPAARLRCTDQLARSPGHAGQASRSAHDSVHRS